MLIKSWALLAFLFPLGVWVEWRWLSRSPPWKKLMILAMYQVPLVIPPSIRTDIAIDRWPAADWWRAGAMAEITLCIAFLVGMALGMRRATSREPQPPIEPNGAQA